jgi:uncharacterized iron-regulated membrane protein
MTPPVPTRPTRGPNRTWRLLQKLHRWASLAVGLVLLAIVLSGVVLVLALEIDEWTQPGLYRSTPSERPLSPEQAVAVVRRELPDFQPVDVVRTRGIYQVWGTEYEQAAHVDPGSGRLLGTSSSLTGVMGFMRNLYLCALSCKGYTGYLSFLEAPTPILGNEELTVGGLILAVFGLMLLFLCVTGIVLWWPGIKRMARGFRVRRRKGTYAFNYDLHNVIGIAAVPLLLMWAITGAGFELKQVRDVWYAVLPGSPPAEVEDLTSKPGSGPGSRSTAPSRSRSRRCPARAPSPSRFPTPRPRTPRTSSTWPPALTRTTTARGRATSASGSTATAAAPRSRTTTATDRRRPCGRTGSTRSTPATSPAGAGAPCGSWSGSPRCCSP